MDILDYLFGLVQSILGTIGSIINYVVEFFQYVSEILYGYIVAIVTYLVAGFKIVLGFLFHIVDDIIHGRFKDLWDDYVKFRDALNQWLAPLRQAMAAYQKFVHQLYAVYLAPVLNFLQSIRKVLAIFRVLGFKWAQTLDNYIGEIEAKLIGWFQTLLQAVNRHADILYLLSTPNGFLRIIPLIHAVALSAENLSRLFTLRPLAFWYGSGPTGAAGTLPTTTTAAAWKVFGADAKNDTGDAGAWHSSFTSINQSWTAELGN